MKIEDLEFHETTTPLANQARSFDYGPSESSYPPSVSLNETQLPEIKDWTTGEEYILVLKVKQTGDRLTGPDGNQVLRADFDILEVAGYYDSTSDEGETERSM